MHQNKIKFNDAWERDCAANKCGGYEEEEEELEKSYTSCEKCDVTNLLSDRHCRACGHVLGTRP